MSTTIREITTKSYLLFEELAWLVSLDADKRCVIVRVVGVHNINHSAGLRVIVVDVV